MQEKTMAGGSCGGGPRPDLADWRLRVWGQVEQIVEWDWQQFSRLPSVERVLELPRDSGRRPERARWSGVQTRELLSRIRLRPAAAYVMVHASGDQRSGFSLQSLASADAMFAWSLDGRPLTPESGWPLRLVVPGQGGPKYVKCVSGLEFLNKPWPAVLDVADEGRAPR